MFLCGIDLALVRGPGLLVGLSLAGGARLVAGVPRLAGAVLPACVSGSGCDEREVH